MRKLRTGLGLLCALAASTAFGQTIETLQNSAKFYAGLEWPGTYLRLCIPTGSAASRVLPTINPAPFPTPDLPTPPGGTPPQPNWYSPPAKIGDNLYFLGTRDHHTFALVANTGEIILIDHNFLYATVPEIHDGLRSLGLDLNKVRYVLIAHAHGDHDGGVHLTEAAVPGVTIVYGEGDWPSVLARSGPHATRFGPQNDGTDGRIITVGDVSVHIVTMPGHTPGTLSFLFEYKDKGQTIKAAYVGGTAISFTNPNPAFYDGYIASAVKFAGKAAAFGADALFSNHTEFDMGYFKAHTALALRALHGDDKAHSNQFYDPGRAPSRPDGIRSDVPNPFFVGQRAVMNYFGVVELCARAAKLRATGSP
jgi:glyoxylase-like metal-dependent hydrolase (beta-lactamase superfamily II)